MSDEPLDPPVPSDPSPRGPGAGRVAVHTVDEHEARYAERPGRVASGFTGLLVIAAGVVLTGAGIAGAAMSEAPGAVGAAAAAIVAGALVGSLAPAGFYLVQPNQALVLILLGRYRGTVSEPGWYWTNPLTRLESRKVSLRVHNFTTPTSKVNDAEGNPIEIAAVVVWRVVDTARAVLEVDDYEDFVFVQSETAIRHLGTQYPYDDFTGQRVSLRADPDVVAASLHTELQDRLGVAGVEVLEARLTHLAYATEIAEAMLRRQQAAAVVAARRTIVEGAVGMVEDALDLLAEREVVELDDERRAAMVSNLLVVLTSEQQTTPVVNTGSLY